MKKTIELTLPPEIGYDDAGLIAHIRSQSGIADEGQAHVRILKRSIDARSRNIKVNIVAEVCAGEEPSPPISYEKKYPVLRERKRAIIVGAGPAGLFAALRLLELGIKPVIVERGKNVRERSADIAGIVTQSKVNGDSNYCFGEGGAGAYSDGKLYTRSKKRGNTGRILEILVAHGANENILYEAHPHIGTDKLPAIIEEMRSTIIQNGGEVHFNSRVVDFIVEGGEAKGVVIERTVAPGGRVCEECDGVILATGHSARDIFQLLLERDILIEPKPFALGVRIEHRQSLIDSLQYRCAERGKYLPPAAYSFVEQVSFRLPGEGSIVKGVFSFCMCPGGFIVPSATSQDEIVVNGMSASRRDSPFANSGLVVTVDPADWKDFAGHGALAGVEYQRSIEHKAWKSADKTQAAPAQRVQDFVDGKISSTLPETSYRPGLTSVDLRDVLPKGIASCLREGLKKFGDKMRGYLTNDALVVGVESRTSSPVRICRDAETLEHVTVRRLFPCGEGAGYSGGIMSSAVDGERCAEALARRHV